jgi:hypothetical protein
MIEEDAELANFAARKFKKVPEFVLPMTVTVDGGEDIPPAGKSLYISDSISRYREVAAFGPLSLHVLRIRQVRHPPRALIGRRPKSET